MARKIIAVFHEKKAGNVIELTPAIAANPTLSVDGMLNTQSTLLPKLAEFGPFECIFTSRMARALDTASVIAMALDLDIITFNGLGQAGNMDKNSDGETVIVAYPGNEADNALTWQAGALDALAEIGNMTFSNNDGDILIVSHRPVIGAMVALAQGITDQAGIDAIVNGSSLVGEGYRIFDYNDGILTLVK